MNVKSPFLWAVGAGLAVLVAAFVPVAWQMMQPRDPAPATGVPGRVGALPAPWQIERGTQGEIKAFGLRLPGSTLADAARLWGEDVQVALIANRGQLPVLEAYTERWTGGGVNGKLVLATDAMPASVARWHAQAAKRETIDANAQRWLLRGDDHAEALRSGITGLSFLPASRIDEATLRQRFGAPTRELAGEGAVSHWLYPERGLAIAWDRGSGRAVVQVVAPADFNARLEAPLQGASSALRSESPVPASGPTR